MNTLNTKTHSSKEIAEFSFENADVKSICYCNQRMKSKLSLSSECVRTKPCKPCTSFASHLHSSYEWCGIGHQELTDCFAVISLTWSAITNIWAILCQCDFELQSKSLKILPNCSVQWKLKVYLVWKRSVHKHLSTIQYFRLLFTKPLKRGCLSWAVNHS